MEYTGRVRKAYCCAGKNAYPRCVPDINLLYPHESGWYLY